MVAGIGLVLGPVIGSPLYNIGGFPMSFYFCCGYYVIATPLTYFCLSKEVESEEFKEEWVKTVTYWSLIKNRWILTSAIASAVTLFQYTFIEPFLSDFANKKLGVELKYVGYVFICLSGGFLIGC